MIELQWVPSKGRRHPDAVVVDPARALVRYVSKLGIGKRPAPTYGN